MKRETLSTSQLAVYARMFSLGPTRTQRRKVQIIEAAIKNYVTIGVENTTYESIAKTCKVTRPLILHHFRDKEEIFELAVKYIRVHYQEYAINAFKDQKTPYDRFVAYVNSTLTWVEEFPTYQRVMNLFYYYCGIDPKLNRLHTELVTMGHQRITALLEEGAAEGVFASDNVSVRARQVQVLITGAIVSVTTDKTHTDEATFRKQIVEGALRLVKA